MRMQFMAAAAAACCAAAVGGAVGAADGLAAGAGVPAGPWCTLAASTATAPPTGVNPDMGTRPTMPRPKTTAPRIFKRMLYPSSVPGFLGCHPESYRCPAPWTTLPGLLTPGDRARWAREG